jgi:pentatricopeptide repeat protein
MQAEELEDLARKYPQDREEILVEAAGCWVDAGQHDRALGLYQQMLDAGCEEPDDRGIPDQHPVGSRTHRRGP